MDMTIKLNLDNDAFKDGLGAHEVYRILSTILVDSDMFGDVRPMDEGLRDLDGNTVGSVVIKGRWE